MTGQLPERITCKSCGAQFSVLADQVPVHSRPVLVDGEWCRIGCPGTGHLPGDAITAMIRRHFPESAISGVGTSAWDRLADEIAADVRTIAAQAATTERERIRQLATELQQAVLNGNPVLSRAYVIELLDNLAADLLDGAQ